jgi:hypothetical protein
MQTCPASAKRERKRHIRARNQGMRSMARLLAAVPLGTALLAGCTAFMKNTAGFLSPDDAIDSYARLQPAEFVHTRFYDEEQPGAFRRGVESVVDGLTSLASSKQKKPEHHRRATISEDGSVITWTGYFNDVNHYQLLRPARDIATFCQRLSAGRWVQVRTYDRDPIGEMQLNPMLSYLAAENQSRTYLRSRNAYYGIHAAQDAVAANVGQFVAEEAEAYNAAVAKDYSWAGFDRAKQAGAFGLFACECGGHNTWYASIVPVTFSPGSRQNQLVTALARIAMQVYTPGSPPPGVSIGTAGAQVATVDRGVDARRWHTLTQPARAAAEREGARRAAP